MDAIDYTDAVYHSGMQSRLPKRTKCEYTVPCEVADGTTHPQHTLQPSENKEILYSAAAEFVVLTPPGNVIANELGMQCDSISEKMQLHPTSCSDGPAHDATSPSAGYDTILSLANTVLKGLGPGYSESIYHKALSHELCIHNISHEIERVIPVVYKQNQVGVVRADIVVQNNMVIEVKAVAKITTAHLQQAERYAKLLHLNSMIVINFPVNANTGVDACFFNGAWKHCDDPVAPQSLAVP